MAVRCEVLPRTEPGLWCEDAGCRGTPLPLFLSTGRGDFLFGDKKKVGAEPGVGVTGPVTPTLAAASGSPTLHIKCAKS